MQKKLAQDSLLLLLLVLYDWVFAVAAADWLELASSSFRPFACAFVCLRFALAIIDFLAILSYFLKGKPMPASMSFDSWSEPALVTIVMFMPRIWSIWSKSISGKINCSRIPIV